MTFRHLFGATDMTRAENITIALSRRWPDGHGLQAKPMRFCRSFLANSAGSAPGLVPFPMGIQRTTWITLTIPQKRESFPEKYIC
jgi:hypothetical protein